MTQQQLHDKARKLITVLSFPESIAAKGEIWCSMQALILTMNLNSCTQEEANERLEKQVAEIETKLKGAF